MTTNRTEEALAAYRCTPFTVNDSVHNLYCRGSGPAVVVLHELPGLDYGAVALADRLIGTGYTVYLPHLFGRLRFARYASTRTANAGVRASASSGCA